MARYYYKALKDKKDFVTGYVEAESQQEAREKIRTMGFFPTNIYEEVPDKNSGRVVRKKYRHFRLKYADKIAFTSELENMFSSGISTLEALENIEKYTYKKEIALIARDMSEAIKNGATFGDAIEAYSETFGEIYVALCRTGEESGALALVLNYLISLLKKQEALRSKFIQMCIYPGVLIFPKLITGMQSDVSPLGAQFIMDSVSFIFNYWGLILVTVLGSVYFANVIIGFNKIKEFFSGIFMKIPAFSNFLTYFSLAHYMAVLHISYESGIPIVKALKMAQNTITDKSIRQKAKQATSLLEKGDSLSDAYYKSSFMPGILLSLVATGEKSGMLGKTLQDAYNTIEKKLNGALEVLVRSFEPTVTIIIGLCVGYFAYVIVSLYSASFQTLLGM